MPENDPKLTNGPSSRNEPPKILDNSDANPADSTVVVDESTRTVLLTDKETIIIEKEPKIDIPIRNRPRKIYSGMWGTPEVAALAAGLLALLASIMLYVFAVVPSNRRLESNRARIASLEKELIIAREKYGNISNTETEVAKLLTSVSDFEANYLPVAVTGRTALYQKINGLIAAYGLTNTTGPDYSPLELSDENAEAKPEEEQGKSKFKSIFPGIYVTMTVEGSYQNLRRFLREIETGGEFIIVSAVELEPSDAEDKRKPEVGQQGQNPIAPASMPDANSAGRPSGGSATRAGGKVHGSSVRLRMEMASYFRRPNIEPVAPDSTEQ